MFRRLQGKHRETVPPHDAARRASPYCPFRAAAASPASPAGRSPIASASTSTGRIVTNSLNGTCGQDQEVKKAILAVVDFINRRENREAGEQFESFVEEASKPSPKKRSLVVVERSL